LIAWNQPNEFFYLQRNNERSPEQEKIEKQRQVPFHMHINLVSNELKPLLCDERKVIHASCDLLMLIKLTVYTFFAGGA
jgi:hypothetical protein